jgi:hypothetical protein
VIRGTCTPLNSPYISGFVYFPPPVDLRIEVPFLVDTGASITTFHLTDLIKLGSKLSALPMHPAAYELKIAGGGTTRPNLTPCGIAFPHPEGGYSMFALPACVYTEPNSLGTAALLGMDVLSEGELIVQPHHGLVLFDCPASDKLIQVSAGPGLILPDTP